MWVSANCPGRSGSTPRWCQPRTARRQGRSSVPARASVTCLARGVLRRRRPDPLGHVRPEDAPARWRPAVELALDHRRRFHELRAVLPDGPIKERVDGFAERVDAGVLAVWDLVQRGVVAQRVLDTIDAGDAARQLKAARRELAGAQERGHETDELGRRVEALAARHAAAQRMWNEVEDLDARLGAVDARLGAVVAHSAELAAGSALDESLGLAVADLDAAVESLSATRAALAELEEGP